MAGNSYEVPCPVSELVTLLKNVTNHTRPLGDAEAIAALDFGYGKYLRALASVRPQPNLSFIDPFILTQGVAEYDIGRYFPPVIRPVRLFVPGSSSPVLVFRYKALTDSEYEARDAGSSGTLNFFYYDILSGMLPGKPLTYVEVSQSGNTMTFDFLGLSQVLIAATYPVGTQVTIADDGDSVAMPAGALHEGYVGVVLTLSGTQVTVTPAPANAGGQLIPMRRRVLRIAPTPPTTYSGRLYYDYVPPHLRTLTDLLDPDASRFRDLIVHYALSHVLRAVNDTEAERWKASADELRAEMMQDRDPLSSQNTESVGSGMPDD